MADSTDDRDARVQARETVRRLLHAAAAPGKVRSALPSWIAILEQVRGELLRAADSLPPSPAELDPEADLAHLDTATELRAVLHIVAEDRLKPAIEDLQGLLEVEP